MVAQSVAVDPRLYVLACQRAARLVKQRQAIHDAENNWQQWLPLVFPTYTAKGFAEYHAEYWDWVWRFRSGVRPPSFVAIWPRGAGKSTGVELACVALAAFGVERYVLIVSETQEQADTRVQNVAGMLESERFDAAYPDAASRRVGKYGSSKGWRRNRIRTASGFTLDAIGLDTAARGVKVDEDRPGLLIFDDIDGKQDTASATDKKITTITETILPAGAENYTVLAVQNLVIGHGVFARLADGRADFLADRIVSGPHPAIRNMETAQVDGRTMIVGGEATWPEGMSIPACQAMIDKEGLTAFRVERQHEVESPPGGMFDHLTFRRCAWSDIPRLTTADGEPGRFAFIRAVVACDPAVTNTDQSDSHGIQADGMTADGTIYRLWSWENRTTPRDVLRRAILKAVEIGAGTVVVETDQGGDLWEDAYHAVARDLVAEGLIASRDVPGYVERKASATQQGKAARAGAMLADYERGRIIHVEGTHHQLEAALWRFPRAKPFDLADAAVWAHRELGPWDDGPEMM